MIPRRCMLLSLLFSCPWLSACGPLTIRDTTTQTQIPIQRGVLELHRDVVIPPNRTRVFFQDGRLLYGINEYYPHCELRVRDISEQAQTVQADRFTIDKVFGTLDNQIVSNGPVQVAAAGATVIASGGGNGESRLMYTYSMALHSDQQPQVTYFVCGGAFEEPAHTDYPTLQDIQTAMGDYATLTLERND